MKKTTYAAVLAAIAVAGFTGVEKIPFVGVPALAQETAATTATSLAAAAAKTFSPEQNLDLSGTTLVYKNLPAGVTAKIVGTTYEQLINFDGKIRNPISPKTTKITFALTDADGNTAVTPTFEVAVPVVKMNRKELEKNGSRAAKPAVVPALQEWSGAVGSSAFVPDEDFALIVPEASANVGEPTLQARVELFAKELSEIFGREIKVLNQSRPGKKDICIALAQDEKMDNLGKEAYALISKENGLRVVASDPLGAFWGTRTILQVFKQHNNTFPCGTAVDYPQYPLRGFMYDIARKPTSHKAVEDVLKTMSYYKMNDYHLVMNNNYIWMYRYTDVPNGRDATPEQKKAAIADVLEAAPTAFRIESDVVAKDGTPLTSPDCFYTKKEFGDLIDLAKLYGVTIVPEFDMPGHAMSLVKMRPDLMYRGKVTKANDTERTAMLDCSTDIHPETGRTYREETLDFVKSIFDEYLVGKDGKEPVFRTPIIHIGTDEYYGDAEDYRAYADAMIKYIKERGYTPRLWGSLSVKKGKTPVDGTGAQIDVWNHGWQNPLVALDHNFDLVNIIDVWAYIVPNGTGNRGGYGDLLDLNFLYSKNWQPHKMAHQEEVIPGYPKMLGAQWGLWNDNSFRGDTGLTDFDFYDRIRQSCAVFAEKTWNTGEDANFRDFQKLVKAVDYAPLSNPEYVVTPAAGSDVLFSLEKGVPAGTTVETGIDGVAPNYVAEIRVQRRAPGFFASHFGAKDTAVKGKNQILFSGPTGDIFVQAETGKLGVTRDTWEYVFDYVVPTDCEVALTLVAEKRTLKLLADGKEIVPVRTLFPDTHKYTSLVFPLEKIGDPGNGFEIKSLNIKRSVPEGVKNAVPANLILDVTANSEHGRGADGDASALWDGDEETYWHSKYDTKGVNDAPPFEITVTFKQTLALKGLKFLPRQSGDNGNIKNAELFAKTADGKWTKIAAYRNDSPNREMKTLTFPKTATTAIKLVILDGTGKFGSMAEIYPILSVKHGDIPAQK